jgi:hypothetical protein
VLMLFDDGVTVTVGVAFATVNVTDPVIVV